MFTWDKFIELYTYLCTFLHVSYTSVKRVYLKILHSDQTFKQVVYILTGKVQMAYCGHFIRQLD